MLDIPNNFYRVSVKALIVDDAKRFLLFREKDGMWELPGGGLDFGEHPHACLKRELREEAGLEVIGIKPQPSYFIINKSRAGNWKANVVYEVEIKDLSFKPTDECAEIKFFSTEDIENTTVFQSVTEFAKEYRTELH